MPSTTDLELQKTLAIILNWRHPDITVTCVQTLQAMSNKNLDILVIDNGSGDNSVEQLKKELPKDVNLITLPENLGFATGSNLGLHYAIERNYPYALLINNDAFPSSNMLTELLKETAPDIALLSPKIYYKADKKRLWFAGGTMNRWTLDLQNTGRGHLDGPTWQKNFDVDYLLGTCLLVNISAVQQVGLLDKTYFMYFEDLDWSIRLRHAGMRLRMVSHAHLYHAVAVSSGGLDSPIRRYHLARSSVIFWRNHLSIGNKYAIILFRIISALKSTFHLTSQQNWEAIIAYWKGLKDGWITFRDNSKEKG